MVVLGVGGKVYAGWTTPAPVTYVHVWGSQFTFILDGVWHGCPGGNGNQFSVYWDSTPRAKELYSLVLISFTAGRSLAVNWSCDSNGAGATGDINLR